MNNTLKNILRFARNNGALIALLLLYLTAITLFPSFARMSEIMDMLRGYSMVGIVAIGMTFVVLTGGIDLSVGSIAAVSGFCAAVLADTFWLLPIIVPIAAGIALGFINGIVITKIKAPPFVATLAMMIGARGFSLIISGEKPLGLKGVTPEFAQIGQGVTLGIPNLVWIFAIVAATAVIITKWTPFGRSVYAIGSNEEAALMMGFSPARIKLIVYMISGFCSGLAGMMLTSRLSSAQNTAGQGWELVALASVVIGGTLLTGGSGKISGTIYGILVYAVIEVLLGRFNLMVWWINIFTGALLMTVVIFQYRGARSGAK